MFLQTIYIEICPVLFYCYKGYIQMLIESAQTYAKVALLITKIGHYKATQVLNNKPKEIKGEERKMKSNANNWLMVRAKH